MDQGPESVKRPRHDTAEKPQILTIHDVECDCKKSHQKHPSSKYFLDVPRLFEGDSKASPLRGTKAISSVDEVIEQNEDVSIILYRKYCCNDYHEEIEESFQPLQQPKHPRDPSLSPYFFYLREYGKEAKAVSEHMNLVSVELRRALHEFTGISLASLEDLSREECMKELYNHFYFQRKQDPIEISALGEKSQQRIRMFQQFMEDTFGSEYDEADELFSQERVTEKHLLKLFVPGEVVVTYQDGEPLAYVIKKCRDSAGGVVSLDCDSWVFDGAFHRKSSRLSVAWPSSQKELDIQDLDVYPLQYDTNDLEERLRKRGQKFWECRQGKYVAYSPPNTTLESQTAKPRYMVDVQTYEQIHNDKDSPPHDEDGPDVADESIPAYPFVLLLPATIRGFGFYDKKWRTLQVEHINDIDWNTEAFHHLVLRHTKKQLIEALIASHNGHNRSTDVIEGKGNGLIFLLHGGPGTGKTLTAESVAELTKRPLYRVTCGDIGTNAEDVEGYLETVFHLGTLWNCVVLLDEADVFLEERTATDLQRNALVSVFLRVLEYYEGILILTSNRIGTFDEAFKSRVQLTLHYPPLDHSGRRRIWANFINGLRLSDVDAHIDQLEDGIESLSTNQLNGREIRNAVRTATLLAQFRKQTLGIQHLDEVIKVSDEFEHYLTDVHGHSSSEWESKGH